MRISDWSSDVCSSDLLVVNPHQADHVAQLTKIEDRLAVGFDDQIAGLDAGLVCRRLRQHTTDQCTAAARQVQCLGQFRGHFLAADDRSEEHTSELQSLMRISYAVFCLKKKKDNNDIIIDPDKTATETTQITY